MKPNQAHAIKAFRALQTTPWALMASWMQPLMAAVAHLAEGGDWTFDEVLAARFSADRAKGAGAGGVAVVPVMGVITQRGSIWDELFGGGSTSTESLTALMQQLAGDENVTGIVLNIDSPGGTLGGLTELGDAIYGMRGAKPVAAVANSLCASAAYWIGSAADEFAVAPESEAGSIGVWTAHVDASGFLEQLGLKYTLVSAGKYKTEGHPYGPLDEEARAHLQSQVNDYYDLFVRAVARNRKDTLTNVREGYGQGRVLTSKEAVKANLADRVASLSQVVGELAAKAKPAGRRASHLAAAKRNLTILS